MSEIQADSTRNTNAQQTITLNCSVLNQSSNDRDDQGSRALYLFC